MEKVSVLRDWYLLAPGETEYKLIDLPDDYSITMPRNKNALGGARNGFFESGVGKYVKYVTIPDEAKHIFLDIDGAYMCATVNFNEKYLTMHPHGYAPFIVDLTDNAMRGSTNKIEITTNALQPSTRWYSGAGLYRDVFLWTGGSIRIEPRNVFVKTPALDKVVAEVTVSSDERADITAECTVFDKNGGEVAKKTAELSVTEGDVLTTFAFDIKDAQAWCPENPYLYTIVTKLYKDGGCVDTDSRRFGIRTVSADSENGLLLNGKPIKLRGGCIHHDHGVLGAAEYPAACRRKLKKLQDAGFNAIRTAHNPPSLTLLELCDEMGILVMDEFFDCWRIIKGGECNYHLWFADHWKRDIQSSVLRDRDHPCVISYSIGNEIPEAAGWEGGSDLAKQLVDYTRSIDDTRLMTFAVYDMHMNFNENDPDDYRQYLEKKYLEKKYEGENIGKRLPNWAGRTEKFFEPLDICGYNYLFRRYELDHELFPKRVIWGSETHAITFYDSWQKVKTLSHVIGDFTWTAYDNLGEAGTGRSLWARDGFIDGISLADYPWRSCYQGDFDLCGYRRPQSYFREAVWAGDAPLHIFTTHPEHYGEGFSGTKWHWYDVHECWTFDDEYIGKPVKCEVYTDADSVEWFLNGRSVGVSQPQKAIATMDILYEKGEVLAVAYKDGKECARANVVTTDVPSKLCIEAESDVVKADNRDLCYFDIAVTDKDGNVITYSTDEITCRAEGGTLLGIFSGDPKNEDQYGSDKCHAFEGRAVAIVKTDAVGSVRVTVSANGLECAVCEVKSEN